MSESRILRDVSRDSIVRAIMAKPRILRDKLRGDPDSIEDPDRIVRSVRAVEKLLQLCGCAIMRL